MAPSRRRLAARTFHHADFSAERLSAVRTAGGQTVSVCLPAREVAETVGPILEACLELQRGGVVDQVALVDAASADGTAELAVRLGAEVHQEADLLPQFGPVLGKGDAMWRALSVLHGDIVVFVDCDSEDFGPHFVTGLAGPLLCESGLDLVKGAYRRPFAVGEETIPDGGGRVTELTARPLLNLFYPELAGFSQPLAGEFGARRELLCELPFLTGYAVEIALLIDAARARGTASLCQVNLESRRNRHQPLRDLGPMAYAVLCAVVSRLEHEGRMQPSEERQDRASQGYLAPLASGLDGRLEEHPVELVERPPHATLVAAA